MLFVAEEAVPAAESAVAATAAATVRRRRKLAVIILALEETVPYCHPQRKLHQSDCCGRHVGGDRGVVVVIVVVAAVGGGDQCDVVGVAEPRLPRSQEK